MDSLDGRLAARHRHLGDRRYLFGSPWIRESDSARGVVGKSDLVGAFESFSPYCRTPATLTVTSQTDFSAYAWFERDTACLAVVAAEHAVRHFEQHYPTYRRPRHALVLAENALRQDTVDAVNRANKAGKELATIAGRITRTQEVPTLLVRCLWAAADAARCVAWNAHGVRALYYAQDAVKIAIAVDPYLPRRLELWLDSHLRVIRSILPTPISQVISGDG